MTLCLILPVAEGLAKYIHYNDAPKSIYKWWFCLVSLFNDISTFMGYLMPKLSLKRKTVVLFNPYMETYE